MASEATRIIQGQSILTTSTPLLRRLLPRRGDVSMEKRDYGRTSMGVERSTFVIAADGTVAKVMRRVKPESHAHDVLAALDP